VHFGTLNGAPPGPMPAIADPISTPPLLSTTSGRFPAPTIASHLACPRIHDPVVIRRIGTVINR